MEQLLADLRSVYATGSQLVAELRQKLEFCKEEKIRLDRLSKQLDDQKHSMEGREAAVKQVENAVALHKKATELHTSAHERLQAAVKAENDLKIHFEEAMGKIREADINSKKIADNNLKRSKQLDEEVEKRVRDICIKNGIKME